MAILTQHAPGTFCWPELGTVDQEGAKKFYAPLLGWTFTDMPMGPEAAYTIFSKNGKQCAALYTLQPEQRKQGVPPNWGTYVSVTNADETAKKAKELGGKVLVEPVDVMGTLGRLTVLQDPTGAVFSAWQPKDHIGAGILDEPGALCWTELMTPDPDTAKRFYSTLIGWKAEDMPMGPMVYTLFKRTDDSNAGGLMKMPDELKGVPAHWLGYFQVENIRDDAARATKLGGQVMKAPTEIPGVGWFAILKDPQGAVFATLQPKK
jgi:predicted enzyme related to lactoylglutathione lyase